MAGVFNNTIFNNTIFNTGQGVSLSIASGRKAPRRQNKFVLHERPQKSLDQRRQEREERSTEFQKKITRELRGPEAVVERLQPRNILAPEPASLVSEEVAATNRGNDDALVLCLLM